MIAGLGRDVIDVAALLASTDLLALVQRTVALRRAGSRWFGKCPFHNEKTGSFMVETKDQHFHCFGCGAHGTAIHWVMRTEGLRFIAAAERLGGVRQADPALAARLAREAEERERAREMAWRRQYKIDRYRDRNPHCCCPDWLLST